MDVYVASAGLAAAKGHRWVRVAAGETVAAEPPGLDELARLVEVEAFSVVLARRGPRLTLLITGLDAGRAAYGSRKNPTSIACLGGAADESTLRGLAAHALADEGGLAARLAPLITDAPASAFGFAVDPALPEALAIARATGMESAQSGRRIAKLDYTGQQALAAELVTRRLPDREGPLVAATTGNVSRQALVQAKVWRGLYTFDDPVPDPDPRMRLLAIGAVALAVLVLAFFVIRRFIPAGP